jgi:exodeoxyribonuclease V alpha subunit
VRPALRSPGFGELAAPFVEAGVLDLGPLHAVDALALLAGERDPEVLLGLAFSLSAPRRGHVGVDLSRVQENVLGEAALGDPAHEARVAGLPWPAADWRSRIEASALVSSASSRESGPFVLHRELLFSRRLFGYQARLLEALRARAARELAPPGPEALAALDGLLPDGRGLEAERHAAHTFLTRSLTLITGGPGSGKTTLVKRLLLLLREARPAGAKEPRVRLAAPTGKAAVRLGQSLTTELPGLPLAPSQRAWLTGLEASTLHRLLGFDPRRPSRFRHHPGHPLEADAVVVDEASMVDLALMTKLLEALPPRARLVLLGDPDQLASVQAGSVLADLAAGPDPPLPGCLVRLGGTHRFDSGGGIGRLAQAIASGDPEALEQVLARLARHELPGVRLLAPPVDDDLPDEALSLALDGYRPYLEALSAGPAPGEAEGVFLRRVLELHESFRVLCAHRAGGLGAEGVNARLTRALAPRSARVAGHWPGRPLLVTENRQALGRMNGDLGLALPAGGRLRGVFSAPEPDRVELLDTARLPPHETAFALTIHKSQGSQFERLLVVLPRRPSPLVTRELIYTAVTRARREVVLCAEPGLLRAALGRRVARASTLAADLMELRAREDLGAQQKGPRALTPPA